MLLRALVVMSGAVLACGAQTRMVADYDAEVREAVARSDGVRHVDSGALVRRLQELRANTYFYLVWHQPTDWDDLRNEFLPAARKASIDVWVYLVPPSECRPACSLPFGQDYIRWAGEIARLSLRYPNLKGFAIDDFEYNTRFFTPDYLRRMKQAAGAVNPRLLFFPQIYWRAFQPAFLDTYAPLADGFIFAYRDEPTVNTFRAASLPVQLRAAAAMLAAKGRPLVLMVYCSRLARVPIPPNAGYVGEVVSAALDAMRAGSLEGVVTYVLNKDTRPEPDSLNRARSGRGRATFLAAAGPTPGDGFASLAREIAIPAGAGPRALTFWHTDSCEESAPRGYRFLQVLVDGRAVWESDAASGPPNTWERERIDLTGALAGKSSATLALRLANRRATGSYPMNAGFDDLQAEGFTLPGGFESGDAWRAGSNHQALIPVVEIFDPQRSLRIFDAVSRLYLNAPAGGL